MTGIKNLGINIFIIRKIRKLSREQLGTRVYYSRVHIFYIENNKRAIQPDSLEIFAKALRVRVSDILNPSEFIKRELEKQNGGK